LGPTLFPGKGVIDDKMRRAAAHICLAKTGAEDLPAHGAFSVMRKYGPAGRQANQAIAGHKRCTQIYCSLHEVMQGIDPYVTYCSHCCYDLMRFTICLTSVDDPNFTLCSIFDGDMPKGPYSQVQSLYNSLCIPV
jgi:hypothetical protein